MRVTTNPLRFAPEDPPVVNPELQPIVEYVFRELLRVAAITNMVADGQLEEVAAAPARPINGMIRLADGTLWNPGSGRGMYWFDSSSATWKFLG